MPGDQYVVKYGQIFKQPDILEGPGNAQLRNLIRCLGNHLIVFHRVFSQILFLHLSPGIIFHHGFPPEGNQSVGRGVHAGNHIESGGLARSVGADQRHDLSLVHIQGQVVYRHHAAKLHGHMFHMKYILRHYASPPVWGFFFFFRLNRPNSPFQVNSLVPMMPRRQNSTTTIRSRE